MNKFINKFSYLKPVHWVESAWQKHAPFAYWLTSVLKPKLVVELGVHNGFSFFTFCQVAKHFPKEIKCVGIDHWEGDTHAGFYDTSIYDDFLSRAQAFDDVSTIKKTSFSEAVLQFDNASINLLHIDGRHFYDDVKCDFETWLPKLTKDAIVLLHDTQVEAAGFGVKQFWLELQGQFEHCFEFGHGHGLGVVCIGSAETLPKKVQLFFNAGVSLTKQIRSFYHTIGNTIHYEYLLKEFDIKYNLT